MTNMATSRPSATVSGFVSAAVEKGEGRRRRREGTREGATARANACPKNSHRHGQVDEEREREWAGNEASVLTLAPC